MAISSWTPGHRRRVPSACRLAQCLALGNALCLVLARELTRFRSRGPGQWWHWMDIDTTPYFVLLAILPLFWWIRHAPAKRAVSAIEAPGNRKVMLSVACRRSCRFGLAAAIGLLSLFVSCRTSRMPLDSSGSLTLAESPPLIHDEYSYLLQANIFLMGRTWIPSHPETPELFDQMHVLNEGRFASRYFPGVGLWLAPFVYLGNPTFSQWLSGSLAAIFVFYIGCNLGGTGVGAVAGLLTALSPGLGIFSNLLLSHHPTLLGLTLFLWSFLRMMETGRSSFALLSGASLAFAMLCRPLTAAAFALPCGAWLAWRLIRSRSGTRSSDRLRPACVLGAPVIVGLCVQAGYNRSITGDVWLTPYSLYNDIYTPRHRYGFNNGVRGDQQAGPKVLTEYDAWAGNLTLSVAVRHCATRLAASWRWTFGFVPLLMTAILAPFMIMLQDRRWWLILSAVAALHAVYLPYWYVGILKWHYVLETAPLWSLLFAAVTRGLFLCWRAEGRHGMLIWWALLVGVSLAVGHTAPTPFWKRSRLQEGLAAFAPLAEKYVSFDNTIAAGTGSGPALVLVQSDPGDIHIEYVRNETGWHAPVLFGRYVPGVTDVSTVLRAFPDRACYLYCVKERQWTPLDRSYRTPAPHGSVQRGQRVRVKQLP